MPTQVIVDPLTLLIAEQFRRIATPFLHGTPRRTRARMGQAEESSAATSANRTPHTVG
jgi:hypothetical protein